MPRVGSIGIWESVQHSVCLCVCGGTQAKVLIHHIACLEVMRNRYFASNYNYKRMAVCAVLAIKDLTKCSQLIICTLYNTFIKDP